MNLDKTFCASDCKNYECDRMASYSTCRAADARGKPLSFQDLSKGCDEYISPEKGRENDKTNTL